MPPVEAAGNSRAEHLENGREAYARREWRGAHASLGTADRAAPLGAEDLELLATSASMLGRDDEHLLLLERAHHRHSGGRRDAPGRPLRIVGRHAPADPGRDGAWRGVARPGAATGRAGKERVRRAGVPARAHDDGARGSRRFRRRLRHRGGCGWYRGALRRCGSARPSAPPARPPPDQAGQAAGGVRTARRNHALRHLRRTLADRHRVDLLQRDRGVSAGLRAGPRSGMDRGSDPLVRGAARHGQLHRSVPGAPRGDPATAWCMAGGTGRGADGRAAVRAGDARGRRRRGLVPQGGDPPPTR